MCVLLQTRPSVRLFEEQARHAAAERVAAPVKTFVYFVTHGYPHRVDRPLRRVAVQSCALLGAARQRSPPLPSFGVPMARLSIHQQGLAGVYRLCTATGITAAADVSAQIMFS